MDENNLTDAKNGKNKNKKKKQKNTHIHQFEWTATDVQNNFIKQQDRHFNDTISYVSHFCVSEYGLSGCVHKQYDGIIFDFRFFFVSSPKVKKIQFLEVGSGNDNVNRK